MVSSEDNNEDRVDKRVYGYENGEIATNVQDGTQMPTHTLDTYPLPVNPNNPREHVITMLNKLLSVRVSRDDS